MVDAFFYAIPIILAVIIALHTERKPDDDGDKVWLLRFGRRDIVIVSRRRDGDQG